MSDDGVRVCTMSDNELDAEFPICICCSCEQNSEIERNQARTAGKIYACLRHPQMRVVGFTTHTYPRYSPASQLSQTGCGGKWPVIIVLPLFESMVLKLILRPGSVIASSPPG